MRKIVKAALVISGVAVGAAVYALADRSIDAPATVGSVDLERYGGQWYEIARYPNRFQRRCATDVTATYRLRRDGKIEVINACRHADGASQIARGTARVVDRRTNAKLKVTFFWPFSGDYWIVDLGADYEYSVVSEPTRKYLWILSRRAHMDEAQYRQIILRLESRGFDTAKLVRTPQSKT
ncbi:MAG: lipocalin family protein [Terriglobales bacterium]